MLPTYEQALATSRDEAAFSNGFEGEHWLEANCCQCLNDADARTGQGPGCVLVLISLEGRTPAEWTETNPRGLSNRYQCAYYRSEDDGPDPEPTPIPDPPGQLTLLPRAPYEQARMLTTYPQPAQVSR
jgi:hypothetical protein